MCRNVYFPHEVPFQDLSLGVMVYALMAMRLSYLLEGLLLCLCSLKILINEQIQIALSDVTWNLACFVWWYDGPGVHLIQ